MPLTDPQLSHMQVALPSPTPPQKLFRAHTPWQRRTRTQSPYSPRVTAILNPTNSLAGAHPHKVVVLAARDGGRPALAADQAAECARIGAAVAAERPAGALATLPLRPSLTERACSQAACARQCWPSELGSGAHVMLCEPGS